jgi:phytol kinase
MNLQDIIAIIITFVLATVWLRVIDMLAARGVIEHKLSRKIIHIGTGPLFVLCWILFSDSNAARYLAALVPLLITGQFLLVGLGIVKDDAAVQAMTRNNNPREILRGPLMYGIVFVVCTVVFWRTSPVGILALMLMCGGDGLADVIGRRFGTKKIPFNPKKSWAGSAAMFLGGFAFALVFVLLFNALGYYTLPYDTLNISLRVLFIAFVAAIVETFPLESIDNLTTTATAILLAMWLL